MKKALQVHTVKSLKSFESMRALEASPQSMRAQNVHSTTCTPTSAALKEVDVDVDIGSFELESVRSSST